MKRNAPDHWKTEMLMSTLSIGIAQAVGHLELLFNTTAKFAPHGDIGKMPDHSIARKCGWEGDPTIFIDGLVACRWIDRCAVNRLTVHDWEEHCDDSTRKQVIRSKIPFKKACPDNGGQRRTTADNGGQNLPTMPNQAKPSQEKPSQTEGDSVSLTVDESEFNPAHIRPQLADEFNVLKEFPIHVQDAARRFWQAFCGQYHGKSPLRNLHSEQTHKELMHFAKAIDIYGDAAIQKLKAYYANPPKEDRQIHAHGILSKLGLIKPVPPPWEAAKKQDISREEMETKLKAMFDVGGAA